jgi:hypothetical protein
MAAKALLVSAAFSAPMHGIRACSRTIEPGAADLLRWGKFAHKVGTSARDHLARVCRALMVAANGER